MIWAELKDEDEDEDREQTRERKSIIKEHRERNGDVN